MSVVAGALVLPAAAAHAIRLPEDRPTPPPNVTFPVALSANPVDTRSYVARRHPGTEINAACGSVVRAATPGTVRIRTDARWAGKSLVKVYTTKYRLTTYYAYLRRVDVGDDQIVQAGQPLGIVGDAGEAKRCQLGFQVRNDAGRTVYNPSRFLDTYVGQKVPVTTLFGNARLPARHLQRARRQPHQARR